MGHTFLFLCTTCFFCCCFFVLFFGENWTFHNVAALDTHSLLFPIPGGGDWGNWAEAGGSDLLAYLASNWLNHFNEVCFPGNVQPVISVCKVHSLSHTRLSLTLLFL